MPYEVCRATFGADDFVAGPFSIVDSAIHEAQRRSQRCDLLVVYVASDRHGLRTRHVRAFVGRGKIDWARSCPQCLGQRWLAGSPRSVHSVVCPTCAGVGSIPEHGLTMRP